MLWSEIKLNTLKKMDPANNNLTPTRNTKDYLNSMVPVANRGLNDLATAGKFIIKKYPILIPKMENVEAVCQIQQHVNQDIILDFGPAKAFYFECTGPATVRIYAGEEMILEREIESRHYFGIEKGRIPEEQEGNLRIIFSGKYPYQFRNVAVYDVLFASDEDVWEYSEKRRFDLRELTADFYKLVSDDVVMETEDDYSKYKKYEWEGDSVLILNGLTPASYIVHYCAYPKEITDETPNDYDLPLDPEIASLLPVYMASELYEDDDTSVAFYFREQYEEGKQHLIPSIKQGRPEFNDVWGWNK